MSELDDYDVVEPMQRAAVKCAFWLFVAILACIASAPYLAALVLGS